ncbi:MAG TPA: CHAT domain-containing protein [Pyrinomonadaceae bacterium]|nr:CHAT domain-containing protein [Pyrinomonadaceae bacterium]
MRYLPPMFDAQTTAAAVAVEVPRCRRRQPTTAKLCRLAASLSLLFCFFLAPQSERTSSFRAQAQIPTAMPFERELSGGEMHTYRLTLNGGQFIRAAFDQRGVDVEVTLLDAGGRELLRVNNPVGVWGPEPVFFEVERGGQYTLMVRPARPTAPPGRYVLTIDTRSARDAGNVESLPADRVFAEGTALLASRTTGDAYKRATEKYREALRLFRAAADRRGETTTLVTIGSVAAALGEQQNALAYFNEALPLLRAGNDRAGEAAALSSIAQIYFALGNKERALENFGSALQLFRAVEDRRTAAYTLANIGLTHVAMTEPRKGLDAFQQALVLLRAVEDRRGQAFVLNHIALVHSSLGDKAEARRYQREVLALVQQINDCAEIAPALSNLAWDSLETGDKQKAIDYLNQALALQKSCSHDRCGQATTLNNLGFVYYTMGERQKSLAHLRQALALFLELEDREGEGDASSNLMYALRGGGQWSAAIFFGKRAINAYQAERESLPSQDLMAQRSFIKSKETTYRELADLLVTQSRLLEAQQVLGLLKEQEYLDYVRRSGDETASSSQKKAALTPAETNAEKSHDALADQLTMRGRERGALLSKQERTPEEEQRLAALDTELQASGQAFQTFLDRLGDELGNTKQAARVEDLRDSQALMDDLRELGSGAVALYTIVGAEKYRVILVTPDVQKAVEYPIKAADLERKILAFREVLQNPRQDARPLAAELYKILIAPIAKDLQGAQAETLMWSLDGALRYLPVAALYDGERYMVERFRNVVFTPASNSRLKDQPGAKWSGLGLGVSKAQSGFSALPGVPEELRGIIGEGENGSALTGKVILDDAFTEETFRAALRQRFPVVHIASHFAVQPGNETDSFLLLGDGGRLSLAKIKSAVNLFGGVELLTLSACDTATGGTAADGKEVESFAVLAQRQGAKAVMASLWPVADASTKQLMQSFYRIRNSQTGMLKAEALRRAQVSLLRGEATELVGNIERRGLLTSSAQRSGEANASSGIGRNTFAHPFFWAPFILIGNWR